LGPAIENDLPSQQTAQSAAQFHVNQAQHLGALGVQTQEDASSFGGFLRGLRAAYHTFTDPTQRALAERCVQLGDSLERTQSELSRLSRDHQYKQDLVAKLDDQLHKERVTVAELRRQLGSYQQECEGLRKWANGIHSQNEEFRTQIIDLETGLGPTLGEDYYQSQFEGLKRLIEKDIVRHSKSNSKQVLSDEAQKEILEVLSKLGEDGEKSARFFADGQFALRVLYASNRWRHAMIRHIAGLFLLAQVFDAFAFGVSKELSKSLQLVEQDILSRGTRLRER
jgi:septal ring factor EnvC (AmiA/AmiB activator)